MRRRREAFPPSRQLIGRRQKLGRGSRGHSDEGFTLIELLITVMVLPLVIGAISVGLISVFSLSSSVGNRLLDSGDAQLVSATFLKDVQSSEMVTTSASSVPQCGTGQQLLGLQWDNGLTVVSYAVVSQTTGALTTYSLDRYYCTLGNLGTPSASSVVSYGIAGSQAPPTVACSPTAVSCAASVQWIAAAGVQLVTFAITEPKTNFSYTLSATPRAWDSAAGGLPGGGSPYAPFTLLDPSSCNALRVGQGSLSINVGSGQGNGVLGVESTCPDAVSISNGGTLAASSVVTADQALNSIAPNDKATYPSTEYYDNQFTDAFAPVAAPSNPTSAPSASCSSTQTTAAETQDLQYTCPPGAYSSSPSFDGTKTVTIDFSGSGTYWFQQGLQIPNNVTVSFAPGIYIFDGSTALSTGSNVTLGGGNVLLYVGSGTVDIGNNNNVSLGASAGYDDIAYWDAASSGKINIGENSNLNFAGGVYMPQGSIVSGENVTISSTFIVADTATFGNNLNLTITSP